MSRAALAVSWFKVYSRIESFGFDGGSLSMESRYDELLRKNGVGSM